MALRTHKITRWHKIKTEPRKKNKEERTPKSLGIGEKKALFLFHREGNQGTEPLNDF